MVAIVLSNNLCPEKKCLYMHIYHLISSVPACPFQVFINIVKLYPFYTHCMWGDDIYDALIL